MLIPPPEQRPIAVRAFATTVAARPAPRYRPHDADIGPSAWTLVADVETTSDAAQQFRFGVSQLRRDSELVETALFYDPQTLTDDECSTLHAYAAKHGLAVYDVAEWIEGVFFAYVYDRNALYVGFNNPFDLSRLAIAHASARGAMRGGFTFTMTPNKYRPKVQVKHLSQSAAFVRFTVPAQPRAARSQRKRGQQRAARRGYFVDVKSTARALTAQSHSLHSLSHLLGTPHQKEESDEHGGPLTDEYLDYATNDVQVTWECFDALNHRYASFGLGTPIYRILSEASIGKATLRQMNIRPWRVVQPDVPPRLIGLILSTYYGGRAEIHIRRHVTRVLYCDFLSMYPTVCTLMGLWRYVIATGIRWEEGEEATADARRLLDTITLADLQDPKTWNRLTMLVQVHPDGDLFPVRTLYDGGSQYSIGVNYLTSQTPLWFTLADCIAAKIITGKAPTILAAIRFAPKRKQRGLRPVAIAGNPDYLIDPATDDGFKRMIDLRTQVKREKKGAQQYGNSERAARLDAEQLAMKITTNATSYGIPAELNVNDHDNLREYHCHGPGGEPFSTWVRHTEEPGAFFHPLLATLITGAARLMLAIAERLAVDEGITWAFCDTDSMAIARPEGMDDGKFLARAGQVRGWFTPLNPYTEQGPVFQIEDTNFRLDAGGKITDELDALYVVAISAKRYVLFTIDTKGRPVIRKASAHGLGHLRQPYGDQDAPKGIPAPALPLHEIGVARWQYDLWYRIVVAALAGQPERVRLDDLPGFEKRAASRYAATTPELLRWFRAYNADKSYREQVRPFGFMVAFPARHVALTGTGIPLDEDAPKRRRHKEVLDSPRVVAPFDPDPNVAAGNAFDRESGRPVDAGWLQTYREAVAQYHLHPEAKFTYGDYLDAGYATRRHIEATEIEHIGKEADRWEEQLYLGEDPEAQIVYGTVPEDEERLRGSVLRGARALTVRALARESGVSLGEVSAVRRGQGRPKRDTLIRLQAAILHLKGHRPQAAKSDARRAS